MVAGFSELVPLGWLIAQGSEASAVVPRVTGEGLLQIYGDFGSVADSQGRAQFSPFLLTLMDRHDPSAHEWFENWRARHYTHLVLTPRYSYPESPIDGGDFSPARFAELVDHVLSTPAHDGAGFRVIVMLSDYPEEPIRERALALKPLWPYLILVPGWETIPSSAWTSKQMSDCVMMLHDLGVPNIGVHLQPGRWAMSSWPVEPDDPWQGEESGCWKSHGGEHVAIFLYQLEHGFTDTSEPDWQNRWRDGVPRMGAGLNGWRVMPLCLFETCLYDTYRNDCSEATTRRVATDAQRIACEEFGVTTISFGNGAPTPATPVATAARTTARTTKPRGRSSTTVRQPAKIPGAGRRVP